MSHEETLLRLRPREAFELTRQRKREASLNNHTQRVWRTTTTRTSLQRQPNEGNTDPGAKPHRSMVYDPALNYHRSELRLSRF